MKSIKHETADFNCPDCDSNRLRTSYENRKFEYGIGADEVLLSAYVPVIHCESCGYSFAGSDASDIEHEAVCKHLGVLSPAEIKELRVKLALSQAGFSTLTGIGIASIVRWESGQLIQNRSYDKFLRLLNFPDNVERLKNGFMIGQSSEIATVKKFVSRSLATEEVQRLHSVQEQFALRVG